jgi:DNA-binding GntR family transcriptional regulator
MPPRAAGADWLEHGCIQVAGDMVRRISEGRSSASSRPKRRWPRSTGVSCITVRHGTVILRERGLIVSIHARGAFVASSMS